MSQDIICSSCGSTLPVESQRVAVAVCPNCDNTLLIKEDQVKNIGVKATLAEPDSCLSVGWRAKCLGREITTHGRVQYKYDGGFWDEYWVRFDGNNNPEAESWISLDEGQYMIEEAVTLKHVPAFEDLRPGDRVVIQREKYVIEEKRSAEMVGFQGYLPFYVPPDRSINYLDLNCGQNKATITYYPDGSTKVFKGRYLGPTELEPIFPPGFDEKEPGLGSKPKRRSVQNKDSREARKVACPNCGGNISLKDGTKTVMVMCSYCDSALDVSEGACKLLATYQKKKIPSVIPIGTVGSLGGKEFLVIGRVRYFENDDGDVYTNEEYQLRADDGEYLFLSWEQQQWTVSAKERLDPKFPDPKKLKEGSKFQALGHSYRVTDRWKMTIAYVEGELSWIAKRGDTVEYMDATSAKNGTLTAEWSGSEIEWYRGKPIPRKVIDKAFGIETYQAFLKVARATRGDHGSGYSDGERTAQIFGIIVVTILIFTICLVMSNRKPGSGGGGSSYSRGSSYSGGGFSSGK